MSKKFPNTALSIFSCSVHMGDQMKFGIPITTRWDKETLRKRIKSENYEETLEKKLVSLWLNLNILHTFF